jgi:hypothetical protein
MNFPQEPFLSFFVETIYLNNCVNYDFSSMKNTLEKHGIWVVVSNLKIHTENPKFLSFSLSEMCNLSNVASGISKILYNEDLSLVFLFHDSFIVLKDTLCVRFEVSEYSNSAKNIDFVFSKYMGIKCRP